MMKPNISLISTISAAAVFAFGASAQEVETTEATETPSCEAMLATLDTEVDTIRAERASIQQEMAVKARELPLLLHMKDGSFVYLGSYDGLAEPLESWFVSEEVIEKRLAMSEIARTYLASDDEDACLSALSEDN